MPWSPNTDVCSHTHSQFVPGIRKLAMPSDPPPLCPLFHDPSPYSFRQEILLTLWPVSTQPRRTHATPCRMLSSFALWFCSHRDSPPIHTQLWFTPSFPSLVSVTPGTQLYVRHLPLHPQLVLPQCFPSRRGLSSQSDIQYPPVWSF